MISELLKRARNDGGAQPTPKEMGTVELVKELVAVHSVLAEEVKILAKGAGSEEAVARIDGEIEKIQVKIDAKADELQAKLDAHDDVVKRLSDVEVKIAKGELVGAGESDNHKSALEKAYVDAFDKQLRSGTQSGTAFDAALDAWSKYLPEYTDRFKNELSRDRAGSGGLLVLPPDVASDIDRIASEVDPIRQLADVKNISAPAWSSVINTASYGVSNRGEREVVVETSSGIYVKVTIAAGDYEAEPIATIEMLEDEAFNLAAHISNEVGIAIAEEEGADFVNGDDIKKAMGFLQMDTYLNTVPQTFFDQVEMFKTGVSGGLPTAANGPFDPLIDLQESMKAVYDERAVWLMNQTTRGVLRKAKDTDANLLWQPDMQAGVGMPLLGSPVRISQSMPSITTASAKAVAYADWKRFYVIVDRIGMMLKVDDITTKGLVKYWTRKRTGGGVYMPEAGKFLQAAV